MDDYESELLLLSEVNRSSNVIEGVMRIRALAEISQNLSTETLMELANGVTSAAREVDRV